GAPDAKAMPVGTERPELTLARALFIRLMHLYSQMAYRLTLLEIQKLAYFLQESGEPLRFQYVAHIYGPYPPNLTKHLENLEGHFMRGYGDTQHPDVEIELLVGASAEAERFIASHGDSKARLDRVANLIEGFETPYGMELIASVHWVANRQTPPARDADEAVQVVHQWNDRKRRMFKKEHIRIAWNRLRDLNWLPPPGNK